jgi:hypothetical protein
LAQTQSSFLWAERPQRRHSSETANEAERQEPRSFSREQKELIISKRREKEIVDPVTSKKIPKELSESQTCVN